MKRFLRLIPLLFLIDACVEPLDLVIPIRSDSFVVDGMITNDPGPYQVKLFYSGSLNDPAQTYVRMETKASVWIMSDIGESEKLVETQAGTYQSGAAGIQGQVGRSYSLRIVTSGGKEYRSAAQKMTSAGQFKKLYVEFEQDAVLVASSDIVADAFSIYVDAQGSQEESILLRWRWSNTYKGKTFPELRQRTTASGNSPFPYPCSGYIAAGRGILQVSPCTCCICWGTESNKNAIISDNRFTKDQSFQKVLLARLPATAMRFYEKYYISVDQLSVSPEVYEFWKLAAALQKSTGSLFQPNSVKVRGNIDCVTNPNEEVLGIFSVSAITKQTLFIEKSQVPFELDPLDTLAYDCREGIVNGTTQKPPFW